MSSHETPTSTLPKLSVRHQLIKCQIWPAPRRYQDILRKAWLGGLCTAQAGVGGWRGRRRAVGVVTGSPELGMLGVFLTLRPRKLSVTSPFSRLAAPPDLPCNRVPCCCQREGPRVSTSPQGEHHGTRQDLSAPASSLQLSPFP